VCDRTLSFTAQRLAAEGNGDVVSSHSKTRTPASARTASIRLSFSGYGSQPGFESGPTALEKALDGSGFSEVRL
jgi:hypothetical protein